MRVPLLILAAIMILGGNLLILAITGTIPETVFAGRASWACLAAFLIVSGVGVVLWANLRRGAKREVPAGGTSVVRHDAAG